MRQHSLQQWCDGAVGSYPLQDDVARPHPRRLSAQPGKEAAGGIGAALVRHQRGPEGDRGGRHPGHQRRVAPRRSGRVVARGDLLDRRQGVDSAVVLHDGESGGG
jgi:hypothetical protein